MSQNPDDVTFHDFIQPYYSDLSRYCRMLAGTPWDGEDLFQETLMKALNAWSTLRDHSAPRAYLFRTATNAWIDYCRKHKKPVDEFNDLTSASASPQRDFELREALELLVHRLPPRQVSVVLLMDVFGFTASATAAMMDVTEAAAKAALYRARHTLQQMKHEEESERAVLKSKTMSQLVDLFLMAFERQDPAGVVRVYQSLQNRGILVTRVDSGETLTFQFHDPDGNVFTVSTQALAKK